MRCRHTVPDWHRYVADGGGGVPIFAACRLLTKDGDRVRDPRSIACAYWGRQEECPLYDGPGKRPEGRPEAPRAAAPMEQPAPAEAIWPVRSPGATDGPRIVLIALSALSAALLIWAAALGLTARGGAEMSQSFRIVAASAVVFSVMTHTLALLRIWARR